MSGGTSGGGGTTQVSMPLTGAQRSEIYNAALKDMGAYMPKASDYQGYAIIDPSADRGRGAIYEGRTGYAGYNNVAPRTNRDTTTDYYSGMRLASEGANTESQNAMAKYLDDYFAKREAAARETQTRDQSFMNPG